MSRPIVRALVAKDFTLFFRNRFFAFVSVLGIVFYITIYFVLPSSVNEELDIGLYAPIIPPASPRRANAPAMPAPYHAHRQ